MTENADLRKIQLEELEQVDLKLSKKKKTLKIFLSLLAVSAIAFIIILLTQKGTVRSTEYTRFNFNSETNKNMSIEVTGLIPIMEESYESETRFYYCIYEAENSPYSNGLIKINKELHDSEKIQAMIKYSEAEFSGDENLPETAPMPIVFYGKTCAVPEDFSLRFSINHTVGNIPRVNPGQVYLNGSLENETTTVRPPIFGITLILMIIFLVLTFIQIKKYSNLKKRKSHLQSVVQVTEA